MKQMIPQQSESVYERHRSVRLRRAAYGGAAFLPEHAATVELDEEAFALLCWLGLPGTTRSLRLRFIKSFSRNVTLSKVECTVNQLREYGFVCVAHDGAGDRALANSSEEENPRQTRVPSATNFGRPSYLHQTPHIPMLSPTYLVEPEAVPIAPESAHLQLNNVCNLRCPSCYVSLQTEDQGALPRARWITLVDEMADMGVFQLALGGGEPLMSPHFVSIVQHSRRRGLLPNVTTNGYLLTEKLLSEVRSSIGEVRLSFNDGVSVDRRLLKEKSALLRDWGIQFGYNVIVTHRNIERLQQILHELIELRPHSVTLIRPKPVPHNERWYLVNALTAHDSMLLSELLKRLEPLFSDKLLTVDCAFSHLFYGLPDQELMLRGVEGCAMGERFVVVAWNGDVYPCSHIQGKEFKMGNVMQQSFETIWGKNICITAHTPARLGVLEGRCGSCLKRQFCGGCRAITWHTAGNARAEDVGCPVGAQI